MAKSIARLHQSPFLEKTNNVPGINGTDRQNALQVVAW